MQNNRRYDLSDRLIHFFRKIDLDTDDLPFNPGGVLLANMSEDTKYSALFMLRCAIRLGELWATWAVRGGKRTIYGPRPAVCFTDMPTAAFLETSKARFAAGQKISGLALTFRKEEMFTLGARPAIYGFCGGQDWSPSTSSAGFRCFSTTALPLVEQFRFVSYIPDGERTVDWTHEREWRWPYGPYVTQIPATVNEEEKEYLPIYESKLTDIGVIVNTKEEARKVLHDVLTLADRKVTNAKTFGYVLVANDVVPATIRDRDAEDQAIANAAIGLEQFFTPDPVKDPQLVAKMERLAKEVNDAAGAAEAGCFGGCWLWLLDSVHVVTRALLRNGSVQVNRAGKYLMRLPEFGDDRGIDQRMAMTEELAKRVKAEFNLECGYFAVIPYDDPDGVPYFNGDYMSNHLIYNWATDGL